MASPPGFTETVFGEAESEKSNGITMTIRAILFPDDACSVNQTLPAESSATEFGPAVLVGSGYSENLEVTCGPSVVVTEAIVVILGVLKLVVGLLRVVVWTIVAGGPGQGETSPGGPPVSVHSEVETS